VSHGVQVKVLPINRCSRVIVPKLKAANYDVVYREFPEGHCVPDSCMNDAVRLLLQKPNVVSTSFTTAAASTAVTVTDTGSIHTAC
jgi:hypothetical protein